MVVSGSTNGTCARMPAKSSGAMLATAPISKPPALPPSATSCRGRVDPGVHQMLLRPTTKSVKVFFFSSSLPCSYHSRPISPPPRTWATANTMPRSSSDSRAMEKRGSSQIS